MMSKWFLVFLLALECQNFTAGLGNFIDVNKFKVFYDPNTKLALKGVLEKVGRDPFPGIGFRGVKCNCDQSTINFTCECCGGLNITRFNFERNACTNLTFYSEEMAIKVKFIVNDKELATGSISGKNPPPFCVPVYAPFVTLCVRAYDIHMIGHNLHACVDLEALVWGWPVLTLHFDCIKAGQDGISWIKPENGNNATTIAPLGMIQAEVNGPEIYDPVNFESPNESPNNPLNIMPGEGNNIGQLKL
ncbi:uncharacterized protein LOC105839360 [Monomorium pharaonis]|uniref:uncharacterized protein LOC105839360 n=1 Tax=Monomorium pharaonis TaxID=307658 RepID=UPI00063FA445|nr:uncharacterized protein LOC105839360 [Monomorium pharaonis]